MQMNTASNGSTPSPTGSSLHDPTLPDAPEVKMEVEDQSERPTISNPLPNGADLAAALKDNPAFQALLAGGALGSNPNEAIARLFGSVNPIKMEGDPPTDTPKKSRLKVFSNGFFMTFDKISSCGNKHFWRCEYKNTCKARMHTDINSEKIVTYIHEHNHSAPTEEEVKLYGLDPEKIERNRVYVVGNIADPNQRRKIRKQVADQEAAAKRLEQQQQEERQKQQNAATIAAARAAYAHAMSGSSSVPTSSAAAAASLLQATSSSSGATASTMNQHASLLLAQLPFLNKAMMKPNEVPVAPVNTEIPIMPVVPALAVAPAVPSPNYISPNLPLQGATMPGLIIPKEEPSASSQPSAKRRAIEESPDDSDLRRDPMFEPTFEIAKKLRKLWKSEPSRYPRTTTTPTTYLDFFISKFDGSTEHVYHPMRIEQRDEAHLREALQQFCGEQCVGMLLFGISPKISVMFNHPMLNGWDNNQFFLIDVSNPSRWRLMYVDDRAE